MTNPLGALMDSTDRALLKDVTHQGRPLQAVLERLAQHHAQGRYSDTQQQQALSLLLLRIYGPHGLRYLSVVDYRALDVVRYLDHCLNDAVINQLQAVAVPLRDMPAHLFERPGLSPLSRANVILGNFHKPTSDTLDRTEYTAQQQFMKQTFKGIHEQGLVAPLLQALDEDRYWTLNHWSFLVGNFQSLNADTPFRLKQALLFQPLYAGHQDLFTLPLRDGRTYADRLPAWMDTAEHLFPRLKGGIEHLRARYGQQLERTLHHTGQPVPAHTRDELQQDVL